MAKSGWKHIFAFQCENSCVTAGFQLDNKYQICIVTSRFFVKQIYNNTISKHNSSTTNILYNAFAGVGAIIQNLFVVRLIN